MSIWRARHKNAVEPQTDITADFPTKAHTKIDITSKLQVIQALDNGQCKADLAREYGVHPRTIAHIYKQREIIIKKYTQKYNLLKQVCNLNLEQNLLEWFEEQYKIGNIITEDQLRDKAVEILKPLSEEFTCIDDWLFSFRMRHSIAKYTPDDVSKAKPQEDWKKFLQTSDIKNIYLGSVFALAHSLDINSYLSGQNEESYVSLMFIVNALGTDKKEIAVVGNELLEREEHVRSLPVNYYYCINSQVNYSVIISYLTKWDKELASQGNCIILILKIPDSIIRNLHFDNIRIVSTGNLNYIENVLEKIIERFKYYYRRLQISRSITYGKDSCAFLDCIHMIGNAWYNVSQKYVQSLTIPPQEGSLYFNVKNDIDYDHSLSRWCKTYNVPLNIEQCPTSLDKLIFCDNKLPCIHCGQSDENIQATEILSHRICQPTSGMEAYQAMKRLVSYLQGESAGGSIMKYAKYLENHLEYGALLQMHQIIGSTNDSI